MLNAMEAKKITKRKEKRYLRKQQKKEVKMLKEIHKQIQKGILTAINNGQYKYICGYRYDCYAADKETMLKGYFILANEKYLKEYYQALGYIIGIEDIGFLVEIKISWE